MALTSPVASRTIRANGLDFACDECGSGDDVALLLHGFPEARVSWRHQLPALAALGWRAVAPDLRGYGASSRPPERSAYAIHHHVEDVVALFDALGARRRLLVGHDWGAAIAWSFALHKARPLDGLVVMNVPHPEVFRRAIRHSWAQCRRSWYVAFFQLPVLPEALLTAGGARAVERAFTGMARNAAAFLRSAPHQPIRTPTLMVWGEHDTALGVELTEGYDGLVEDFTLHRLPDASHWVQQDRPEKVNAILAEWLAAKHLANTAGKSSS